VRDDYVDDDDDDCNLNDILKLSSSTFSNLNLHMHKQLNNIYITVKMTD
jgi:hypothetical protein